MTGPLAGVRVIEFAGLGPGPFAVMMLADLGADVVRVERGTGGFLPGGVRDVVLRGRRSIAVDLKSEAGRGIVRELTDAADVVLEGFRPGVMERLGLGPDDLLARNPRLVFTRMTGWGQDGPLAPTAGHDITYLARTGTLSMFRRAGEAPVPPANLLGDFGGGSLFAVVGILAALHERTTSGLGQVVDAAIVDGVGLIATFPLALAGQGMWAAEPGHNLLDTGAPFYEVYECADGRHVAVGALEDKFYAELVEVSGIRATVDDAGWALVEPGRRHDPSTWAAAKPLWARLFRTRTRDEWAAVFAGGDACVEPVLELAEVPTDAHSAARGGYVEAYGTSVPAPAPRFSRTGAALGAAPVGPGAHTDDVLRSLGRTEEEIAALRAAGAVG